MSTDLYGVRVLDVAPRERRVRLRVFVVYYDTTYKYHQPIPDDASFFFRYLCETSDSKFVAQDDWLDEPFVDEHAWRFIERVQRIATRNFPVGDYADYDDFYYERGGRWADEDKLVQADYDVWVTDERWIAHLTIGESRGTTCYPTRADRVRGDDAAHVPDLRRPLHTIEPFPNKAKEAGTPGQLAYSDDGRYLAVVSDECELVIYDVAAGYREDVRMATKLGLFCEVGWIGNVCVQAQVGEAKAAYDVDARAAVAPPIQRIGRVWSRNHRVYDHGHGTTLDLDGKTFDVGLCAEAFAFTHDEARVYVGGMAPSVVAIDLATETIARTLENVADERVRALTTNRDGSYIVLTNGSKVGIVRVSDGDVIADVALPRAPIPTQPAWSPDGTHVALLIVTGELGYGGELRVFPVGLPAYKPTIVEREPAVPEPSAINRDLVHQLASASPAFTTTEWHALVAAHARWLDSGGGGGDGGLPDSYYYESPWNTFEAAGLVLAVWNGPKGTDGTQAVLRMRRLDDVALFRARLAWADLSGACGENLDFSKADLRGVTATDAHLPNAIFRNADLRMADFSRSNLRGADFTNANLEACDFDRADLTGANFTGARIGGIKLRHAVLADSRGFGS